MIYVKIIIKVFQLILYNNKNRNYEKRFRREK